MQSIAGFLSDRSVAVLAVSFTPHKLMKIFIAENPQPFPIVSDPNKDAYRAFDIGRASILSFFRPGVIWKFVRQIFGGLMVKKPLDKDVLQLGGDFLFDAEGRVVWSWPSRHPQDRPTPAEIRKAVEAL